MRVLIIDEWLPDPRFGAGSPRAAELLGAIVAAGCDATMYPMNAGEEDYVDVRQRFPSVAFLPSNGKRGLRRLVLGSVGSFDLMLVSRPTVMAKFARVAPGWPARHDRLVVVYDAEAIFTARESRRLPLFGEPMSSVAYEAALDAEIALTRGARAIISVTEAEARLFRSRVSTPVHVISHTTPVRTNAAPFDQRADLLFVGRAVGPREEIPNVDSLIWFVEEVMPRLDRHLGDEYRLVVTVGSTMSWLTVFPRPGCFSKGSSTT